MNDLKNENLKELLAGFMDSDSARRMQEDIEKGDQLLGRFSAPSPRDNVIAGIKIQMAAAARRQHRTAVQHRIWAAVSVAAAIVAVSAFAIKYFERGPVEPTTARYATVIPDKVWEGSDITADDVDIAMLMSEVKTIENELSGVQLKESSGNAAVSDLETELIEIDTDFWKG